MITLNQKEQESKYLTVDDIVVEINSTMSLEEIYDKLRKGEDIPESQFSYQVFKLNDGDVIDASEFVPDRPQNDKAYNFVFEDENSLDDERGKVKRERSPILVAYEKFLLGTAGPEGRFTKVENPDPAIIKKEIAAALGIMPCLYGDKETPVLDLRKLSARGDRLYWEFSSFSKENRLPSEEELKLYDSLSAYEKRIIADSLMHPMALLDYVKELKKYGKDTKLTKEAEILLKSVHDRDHTMEKDVVLAANAYQTQTLYNKDGIISDGFSSKKEAEATAYILLSSDKSLAAAKEAAALLFERLKGIHFQSRDSQKDAFSNICKKEMVLTKEMFEGTFTASCYDHLYEIEFAAFMEKKKADVPTKELMEEFISKVKTPVPEVITKISNMFKEHLPRVPQIIAEYAVMQAIGLGKGVNELSDFEIETMAKNFDFKNVQVVRPYNNPALYAFCDKLNFKDMKKEHLEVFATHLRPNMVKPLISKGFVEWYEKYKDMNASDLSAILSLNKEVLSGYGSRIRENYFYAHERINHFTLDKDAKTILHDVRLMRADGDRKKFDEKYRFKFKDQELAIKGRHTVVKQGKLTMEMMQPGDLRIYNAGQDTCCCQEWGNAGEGCVAKIVADPFATEVAIVKKGTVIAQGFVWVDNEKDTLVFDNVEFANYKTVSFDNRIKDFTDLFAEWSKAMPYANVHIGTGCLAASMAGWGQQIKQEEFAKMPTTMEGNYCYSDYHANARTIKRNGSMLIAAKGDVQVTTAPDEPTRWDVLRDNPAVSFLLNDYTQSPEERIRWANEFLEHPTESLQMMAVQRNPQAIKGLDDPCVDVQVWIARNHPELVVHIANPCAEIQDEIVRQNPRSIKNIQTPTEQMMIYAVEADKSLLKFLNDKNPSDAVYLAAVKKDGLAIVDVPRERRTEEICLEAVKQKAIAISHIKDPVESVWKKALDKDATVIKLIKDPSKEQQVYAVTKKPSVINQIYHPCYEAISEAVRRDGLLIRNFQMQYPNLRMTAIVQNPFVVTNGAVKNPTDREYVAAVLRNPAVLNLIRSSEVRRQVEDLVRAAGNEGRGGRNQAPEQEEDFER